MWTAAFWQEHHWAHAVWGGPIGREPAHPASISWSRDIARRSFLVRLNAVSLSRPSLGFSGRCRQVPSSLVEDHREAARSGLYGAWRQRHAQAASGVRHAPPPKSVEAIVFMTGLSKWKRTGQLRPYVRPVMRHLPLAIMGVRLRVRHQSVGRAQGTGLLSVLPKLYVLDYRFSHHAVQLFLPVRRAFARRPPRTGLSCHNFRCSYDA